MLFTQFVDEDLGCASYLVGDESVGEAVLVDPGFAVERYVEAADRHGLKICCVLETHTHADHVSGHGRLALEQGVPVRIHPASEPDFDFEPIADGTTVKVGEVRLEAIHTPGHRPEHCCFAVIDESRADEPWLVLTGDSLLVGDTARPDLAVAAREGAEQLFHSLERLMELPDGVELYPGHVAGSLCGAGMSSKPSSTIGFERRFNRALGVREVERFVEESTAGSSPRPPNMERIVQLNRGPFLGRPPDLQARTAPDGATILDVRTAKEFAAGHVAGAINVPVSSSSFATRAAFVLEPDERVVLHAGSSAEARRAARALNAVGMLDLEGYLEGVDTPVRVEPLGLEEVERLLAAGQLDVLDVREKDERAEGFIPGSRHIPFRLVRACAEDLKSDVPVATICESGARATIAASILAASGVDARPVVDGGVGTWRERGNATVQFRRCGST